LDMTATEAALYKLQLAGATDEQIRAAASSLAMIDANEQLLRSEEELQKQKEKFGKNPQGHIRGNVSPLSGGAFDTQSARYAAEAEAERKRYADQLARLSEAKNLELLTKQQYHTLEQEME